MGTGMNRVFRDRGEHAKCFGWLPFRGSLLGKFYQSARPWHQQLRDFFLLDRRGPEPGTGSSFKPFQIEATFPGSS